MDICTLCKVISEEFPTAKVKPIIGENQAIIGFDNRPDVELTLLTPWQQRQLAEGVFSTVDFQDLMSCIERIASYSPSR